MADVADVALSKRRILGNVTVSHDAVLSESNSGNIFP